MEDQKQFHFYDAEMRELTIRQGKAPDVYIPEPVAYVTTINGPADYFSTQHDVTDKPIKTKPVVKYSIEKGRLDYINCIHTKSSVTVSGTLVLHPDLQALNINALSGGIAPRDLAMKLKRMRHHFPDQALFAALIKELTNLTAKISTAIESSEEQKGDRKRLVDKVVDSNIPEKFKIHIPIFIGTEPVSIYIEIHVDTSESSVIVQLHSPDLIVTAYNQSTKLITEQLNRFDACIPKLHCI